MIEDIGLVPDQRTAIKRIKVAVIDLDRKTDQKSYQQGIDAPEVHSVWDLTTNRNRTEMYAMMADPMIEITRDEEKSMIEMAEQEVDTTTKMPRTDKRVMWETTKKEEEEAAAKKRNEPLSLEELLDKKKQEEAARSKPVFITKEQRAAEAIKRRQDEVAAMRAQQASGPRFGDVPVAVALSKEFQEKLDRRERER